MQLQRIVLMSLVFCVASAASPGAVLTFGFEGDVTTIHDPVGIFDFVQPGQRFVYAFTFDTDAPNVFPEFGPYHAYYEGISSSATVGGFAFTTVDPMMHVYDAPPGDTDAFSVGSSIIWDQPQLIGFKGVGARLSGGNVLQSVSPPQSIDALNLFTDKSLAFQFEVPGGSTGELAYFGGFIDSIRLVPEPSAGILLALGALLIRGRRGRI